ncbi:MAG: VWA domain-containing protein [Actinomycetota bacterium]|nr:VWA domain-containing protein [Actinomycetota bacterium]
MQAGYGLVADVLSDGRRTDARLVTGEHRAFGLDPGRTVVHVPYGSLDRTWTRRTITGGIALQCAPSKDRIAGYALDDLSPRERRAVAVVEGRVALGWVASHWGGLVPELQSRLADLEPDDPDRDGGDIVAEAVGLAAGRSPIEVPVLLGRLPHVAWRRRGLGASLHRRYGRMPWSSTETAKERIYSIPVGGDGGVRNPNLPPPSRPEDEELEARPDERVGVPYPEWNVWTKRFLADHVAVLERPVHATSAAPVPVSPAVRRWFEERTHRVVRNGLQDGSDLDIDRYVEHVVDAASGAASEPRVFRDLVPGFRDVTTALLLDGSSSLSAQAGKVFELELECADSLSQAMNLTGERHGVFVFSGNTRHRVDVRCIKDFDQPRLVVPGGLGLVAGGYTRLGAPIRHLTSRLLAQRSQRRLLITIGDGLMSDEGYEGHYAWADVAHAVEEAEEAGVAIYYIGVGTTRVDPLPEVFGLRRSQRIRRVEELPRVLAHVHRELVAA